MLEIKKVSITKTGLSVKFNRNPLNYFHTLPGAIKTSEANKYIFPAQYSITDFIEFLRIIPKKNTSILLDVDLCPIILSRTYRFKMYKPGTGKPIPGFNNYDLRGLSSASFEVSKKLTPPSYES